MEPSSNNENRFSAGSACGDILLQELRKIHPECREVPFAGNGTGNWYAAESLPKTSC